MDSSTTPDEAVAYPAVTTDAGRRNSPYSGLMLSTARYLLRTDVHTFAFSVAANSILSFFPFLVLLMTLTRNIFHSWTMSYAIEVFLRDALPAGQDFVIHNLNAIVSSRHRAQILSLLILLVTSTGIFMPLEVALNRVWGFRNNRSYFGNQLISLGLAFACGLLALLSNRSDCRKHVSAAHAHFRTRRAGHRNHRIPRDEDFRHRRQHWDLLPDLLAAAQRTSLRPNRSPCIGHDGIALGNPEVWLHRRAAAP